jgi:hypothetical protein
LGRPLLQIPLNVGPNKDQLKPNKKEGRLICFAAISNLCRSSAVVRLSKKNPLDGVKCACFFLHINQQLHSLVYAPRNLPVLLAFMLAKDSFAIGMEARSGLHVTRSKKILLPPFQHVRLKLFLYDL